MLQTLNLRNISRVLKGGSLGKLFTAGEKVADVVSYFGESALVFSYSIVACEQQVRESFTLNALVVSFEIFQRSGTRISEDAGAGQNAAISLLIATTRAQGKKSKNKRNIIMAKVFF